MSFVFVFGPELLLFSCFDVNVSVAVANWMDDL